MNKRLLFPLIAVMALVLASLACLDTNYYGVQPSAPVATSTPQEVAAAQEGGQDIVMAVVMIILVFWSGLSMMGHVPAGGFAGLVYQTVYWGTLLGGIAFFAAGVFTLSGFWVALGAGLVFASVPWGLWGHHLF